MTSTGAAGALSPRARQIAETRRRSVHTAVNGVFELLLPLQWLGSGVLCLLQSAAGTATVSCSRGLNPWLALVLSTLINGATLAVIHGRSEQAATRYVIGASQVLFYTLLTCIGATCFHTCLYLFVSLALVSFYREQSLLLTVASGSLAVQWIVGIFVCPGGNTATLPIGSFSTWVLLEWGVLALVCHRGSLLFRNIGRDQAQVEQERENHQQEELERTRQLAATNDQYRALLESTSAVPWELDDSTGACSYIGAQVQQQWGWAPERFQESSFLFSRVHPDDRPTFAQALEDAVASHDVTVECRLQLSCEKFAHVRSFMRHAPNAGGRIVRGISIDITTQKKLEMELYQAQKLESIGRLAAGVAHEINTPVQFVNDNCYFLRDAVAQIGDVLRAYQETFAEVTSRQLSLEEARTRIDAVELAADLPFLSENMPTAVERSLEGLERVATIVRSMKEFSHPNTTAMSSADLNAAIHSTLTVARNEYKYVAEIETHLEEIPPVICYVSEFNQVFLNILVNAAQAIGDAVADSGNRGTITVRTRQHGASVVVSVQDTGGGIPEAIQANIFDPFFTTKEVGKGTGQGLSIARSVIVDKHHGSLTFESVPGVGTTFFIRLPLDPAEAVEAIAA